MIEEWKDGAKRLEKGGPIIIIGMHRSGTTMLAQMLRKCGLFIGADLESNQESKFFININEWILNHAGGSWLNPQPIENMLKCDPVKKYVSGYVGNKLASLASCRYWGRPRLKAEFSSSQQKWGWKDPRNTFTACYWANQFPGAKIIHIYRNGIDAADSLRRRELRRIEVATSRHEKKLKSKIISLRARALGITTSHLSVDIEGAFNLWEKYISHAFFVTENIECSSMTIRYEDLLRQPAVKLACIAEFCELEVSQKLIGSAIESIDVSRGYSYKKNKALIPFYQKNRENEWLRKLEYVD